MIFISVVRDFEMYCKCVRENSFNSKGKFTVFNNIEENKTIPKRYNSFLDAYDYTNADWFIFCHEDWELKEDISKRLSELDKKHIYGPTGIIFGIKQPLINKGFGQILTSNKDGSNLKKAGVYVYDYPQACTLDCQCLIVHSSLIEKYNLRFDENLSFDLYTEDFCIAARENYNIQTRILQLKCQHYSFGSVGERYKKQFRYMQEKYSKAKYTYSTTCSKTFIGKNKVLYSILKKLLWPIRKLRRLKTKIQDKFREESF